MTKEKEKWEILFRTLLILLLALPFALAVNGAGGGGDVASGSDFVLDGNLTVREVILASSTITGSKHDFTYNASLTPKGECSACHNVRIGEPFLWTRSLTEEQSYFTQNSNPNYIKSPTIYCYDCHDNHVTVDNDPDYRYFINELSGRYIPQDVAFDSNLTDKLAYNSTPLDSAVGFYETAPPNSVPPVDGRPTGGHYIKSNPSGLTNINQGDKLPCTDCHEPHNSEPTNEGFLRGNAWFPLGGKVAKNLKASTKTRSGTGTGRAICTNCHGYNDTGTPVRFVDINAAYGSTETIIRTPPGVIEHVSTNTTACTDCHTHDSNCGQCHGSPPYDQSHVTHYFEARGPIITTCFDCHYFSTETHKDGTVNFGNDASQNFTTTTVCDACHSPGGSFDGVNDIGIGAKPNWAAGVYESGALKAGKEKWCAGCHDDDPAYSKHEIVEPIILDDPDATYVCSWAWRDQECGYYGYGYRWHAAGTGSCTATWTPNIPKAGDYKVYAWWQTRGDRASNAPYTINYDGGSETVLMDQRTDWDKWNYVGTFPFAAGTSNSIVLSDDADMTVIADAVMLDGSGAYAPNVIGDNTTFGYYVSGHKISCTNCHDPNKSHIDHEQRTYEADEAAGEAVNPYSDSYRLKDLNGQASMVVPRWSGNPVNVWLDFSLCFDCHNHNEVLGDISKTNFWNNDASPANSHNIHLGIGTKHFDSDWDSGHSTYGATRLDSQESCIACHNVHGSPTRVMIRHGELISSYHPFASTFTWTTPENFTGGNYSVYARWTEATSRASNARYTINYNGGSAAVHQDQRSQGGEWVFLGNYSFADGANGSVVLDNEYADGTVIADAIGWDSDGNVTGDPEIVVDNTNGTAAGDPWRTTTGVSGYYGADYLYQEKMKSKISALAFSYLVPTIATATWSAPNGSYYVYANWTADPSRASNAKYTINHTGGSETVYKNQRTNGTGWNQLGTGPYTFGTGDYVELSNEGVDGIVIADAIGWDSDGNFTSEPEVVVDNPNATYVGTWPTSSWAPGYYGTNYQYQEPSGDGVADPEGTLEDSVGGMFGYGGAQVTVNGVCGACHGPISYTRTPLLNPRVLMPQAEPSSVDNKIEEQVLLTAYISAPSGTTISNVTIDLTPVNGSATQLMYDDGTHGDQTPGDQTYSYQTTVAENVTTGFKALTISANNSYGTGTGDVELMVANPGWFVIDNRDADFRGYWSNSDWDLGYQGTYFKSNAAGTGSDTATFTPALLQAGTYNVYAWWVSGTNRATNAPFTINYSGGSDVVRVNQKANGSLFVLLGTYSFDAQAGYAPVIVDTADAAFVGDWVSSTSNVYSYGGDLKYITAGTGANTATFTPSLPVAGNYSLYAWWTQHSNRATNAPFTIYHSNGSDTVLMNQENGGGGWNYLGTYHFDAGTNGSVVLSDDANEYVIADAIKWQLESELQRVMLSDDANGYVIADAIMFEPAWLTPTAIVCSDLNNGAALIDNNLTTGNLLDTGTEQYVVFDLGSNYTVTSIRMYTDGNNYTWDVALGNTTSGLYCCNYSALWGTLVLDDWQTTEFGWTETEIPVPRTARYLKLMRSDGSGNLNASSLYEFMFDPPEVKVTYELHSYADLHIYDPEKRHVGMNYTTGAIENEIPGAACHLGEVQTVSLPKLAVGEYRVLLKGTGTGGYELVVSGESEGGTLINETFAGTITKDEIHDATTAVNTLEVSDITVTVEDQPEPTVQMVGVANVTLAGLYPGIDLVTIDKITLASVNTTLMPEEIVDVHSAYMINATGGGTYALRFEEVENAETITAVYKVGQDGSWIPLSFAVKGSVVEVTLEAGNPPVVFASVVQPEPEPTPTPTITPTPTVTPTVTPTPTATPKVVSGGGGGSGGIPAYLLQFINASETEEESTATSTAKTRVKSPLSGQAPKPTTNPPATTVPTPAHASEQGETVPGFDGIFAVLEILAIAFLVLRRQAE